jgi:hypothetical protein
VIPVFTHRPQYLRFCTHRLLYISQRSSTSLSYQTPVELHALKYRAMPYLARSKKGSSSSIHRARLISLYPQKRKTKNKKKGVCSNTNNRSECSRRVNPDQRYKKCPHENNGEKNTPPKRVPDQNPVQISFSYKHRNNPLSRKKIES